MHDDGSGSALYVGGAFKIAGSTKANNIAKWDGSNWTSFGQIHGDQLIANTFVKTIISYGDEASRGQFIAGSFRMAGGEFADNITSWNNKDWVPLLKDPKAISGEFSLVTALTVFDDGSGEALYAGGSYSHIGSMKANGIAKWDGEEWSAVGRGFFNEEKQIIINALEVFDDGTGPALYAAGEFTRAGGLPASNIAKWNGSSWNALDTGLNDRAQCLEAFDDGNGEALYVGGQFTQAGDIAAAFIAKWDGSDWTAVGNGLNNSVKAFEVFDENGSGASLYAMGSFSLVGNGIVTNIARLDGTEWRDVGGGITNPFGLEDLVVFDDGSGAALYVGGAFGSPNIFGWRTVAKWDGADWVELPNSVTQFGDIVYEMFVFNDGSGDALYIGGSLIPTGIRKWDGASWSVPGNGVSRLVFSFAEFTDQDGSALYVGGDFNFVPDSGDSYLAKWGCASLDAVSLSSDVASLSLNPGGRQTFALDGGVSRAGWSYTMLGSLSGTSPGITFNDGVHLQLNWDGLCSITVQQLGLGAFTNYRGTLDGNGQAQASFTLPAHMDPGLVGATIHHAFLAGSTTNSLEFASNSVSLTLVL